MEAARTDLAYWLALHRIPGVGPVKLRRLAEHFGDLSLAWRASPSALAAAGLDPRAVEAVLAHRPRLEPAALCEAVAALGVQVLTCLDPQYPERLRAVPGAPALLFIKGALQPADDWALAVVGTRHPTAYGRQVTQRLVTALVGHGLTIVSGLARGIDAEAHQAALQAGGRTLAVLGCGIDQVYPPEHRRLAARIVEHGALLSELPLGASPEAGNFPARNRIISGLSRGVLVVEAGERSGALISATCAAEQGREVFAVPGSIFSPKSQGTHRLIQQGATLVQSAQDILEALNMGPVGEQLALRALLPPDEAEGRLLALLGVEPLHIDEIVRASGRSAAEVGALLTTLELKGLVRHLGGQHYARTG